MDIQHLTGSTGIKIKIETCPASIFVRVFTTLPIGDVEVSIMPELTKKSGKTGLLVHLDYQGKDQPVLLSLEKAEAEKARVFFDRIRNTPRKGALCPECCTPQHGNEKRCHNCEAWY